MCKKGTSKLENDQALGSVLWIGLDDLLFHVGGSMCDAEAWPRTEVSCCLCATEAHHIELLFLHLRSWVIELV